VVAVGLGVIGEELRHHYEVNTGGVVGIRLVNDRYDVVFDNGYRLSFPASHVIVVYKEVGEKQYVSIMNKLYYEREYYVY